MPTAFGYVRVSTSRQVESGLSLEAQRDQLTKHFESRLAPQGFTWGGFYEDPETSARIHLRNRQSGCRLDLALERGDAVLFARLDRGFRSVPDCCTTVEVWTKRGVRVLFLDLDLDTGTPAGEFGMTVLAAAARLERRMIGVRVADAWNRARARDCYWTTCPGNAIPWGLRRIKKPNGLYKTVRNEEERTLMSQCLAWYEAGYSHEQIREHLNRERIPNPRKKGPWPQCRWENASLISRMIQSEVNWRHLEAHRDAQPTAKPS